MSLPQIVSRQSSPSLRGDLSALIASIGEPNFDSCLVELLNKVCGAEHACLFLISADKLTGWGTASIDGAQQNYQQMSIYVNEGLWRHDPTFGQARAELDAKGLATVRTDISQLEDDKLRDYIYGRRGIRDRVVMCGRSGEAVMALTMCSSDTGFFTSDNMRHIESMSDTLFALLAKHIDVSRKGSDASLALTTLDEIEMCISEQMPVMPRREAEVCSRAIYGISSLGISLELGISQETVMTYRKRAYSRLGIATQRELFLWYLKLWSAWRGRTIGPSRLH
jgi:DNA-binding CsgD family transcriptional regulator